MPFTGKVGDTLRLNDSAGGHQHIILTEPNDAGCVVMAYFTSATYWKEWIVTFRPKHNKRLFTKKTTVNYKDTHFRRIETLLKRATNPSSNYIFCHENHCKEIIIGAFQSQHTPQEILQELSNQYPDESAEHLKM